MNQTSSIVTGGITISAATVEPVVSWALGAITHAPILASVLALVTGLICVGVHAAINYLSARGAVKGTTPPAQA